MILFYRARALPDYHSFSPEDVCSWFFFNFWELVSGVPLTFRPLWDVTLPLFLIALLLLSLTRWYLCELPTRSLPIAPARPRTSLNVYCSHSGLSLARKPFQGSIALGHVSLLVPEAGSDCPLIQSTLVCLWLCVWRHVLTSEELQKRTKNKLQGDVARGFWSTAVSGLSRMERPQRQLYEDTFEPSTSVYFT